MNKEKNSLIEFNEICIDYIEYIETNFITYEIGKKHLLSDLKRLISEDDFNNNDSMLFTFEMFKNYFTYHKNSKQHQQAKKYFNRIEHFYHLNPTEQLELTFEYTEETKKPN